MSFSTQDVLNTVKRTFDGNVLRNVIEKEPIFEEMLKLEKFSKAQQGGDTLESTIIDSAGVTGMKFVSGLEQPERRVHQITKNYKVTRQVLGGDMVFSDMEERTLRQDRAALASKAKELHTHLYAWILRDLGSWFLSGKSTGAVFSDSDLRDLLTLNGQINSGTLTGTINGLLSFEAPATQIGTGALVENLARQADIHFNQCEAVSAFPTDGFKQMQKAYLLAKRKDVEGNGPTLAVGDLASYLNLLEHVRSQVRVTSDLDQLTGNSFQTASFGPMKITYSEYIDPANYSAHAGNFDPSNGLFMFLSPQYIQYFTLLTKMIEVADWKPSDTQRAHVCRFDIDGNFLVRNLPAFATVVNTAS
tara:strand:- start:6043 stop:7125 length:1083 start_codon:yes stop_codon:yes gene_type:complete